MDNKNEVREFLTSRRANLTPEKAGVPGGGNRRVAGLRRGEVAALAGVSVEYYAKLERGNIAGASESVLHAKQMTPQALYYAPPDSLMHRFVVGGERTRKQNSDTAEATTELKPKKLANKCANTSLAS